MNVEQIVKWVLGGFMWLIILVFVLPAIAQEPAWKPTNGPYGGAVYSLIATPDGTLYAGTWGWGVFRSKDAGDSWMPINSELTNLNVNALVRLGTTLYAGTSEGIFRLVRGDRWVSIKTGLNIRSLVVSESGAIYVLAHGNQSLFRFKGDPNSWEEIPLPFPSHMFITSLLPSSDNILYSGIAGHGIFVSEDGGRSWKEANNGIGNIGVDVTVLISSGTTLYAGTLQGEVFRLENEGKTWLSVSQGLPGSSIRTLMVWGNTLYVGTYGKGAYRSEDKGNSWTPINVSLTSASISFFAVLGETLYAAGDTHGGGVFRSDDKGNSWQAINFGLTNYHILSLLTTETTLYAGATNGELFRLENSGNSWLHIPTNFKPFDIQALALSETALYAGTNGGVFRTADEGKSWINVPITLAIPIIRGIAFSDRKFYMATSRGDVFYSEDGGNSWTQIRFQYPKTWNLTALKSWAVRSQMVPIFVSLNNASMDNFLNHESLKKREGHENCAMVGARRCRALARRDNRTD